MTPIIPVSVSPGEPVEITITITSRPEPAPEPRPLRANYRPVSPFRRPDPDLPPTTMQKTFHPEDPEPNFTDAAAALFLFGRAPPFRPFEDRDWAVWGGVETEFPLISELTDEHGQFGPKLREYTLIIDGSTLTINWWDTGPDGYPEVDGAAFTLTPA